MQSFVFVACLLASLASANPVQVEPRGFGGYSAASQQHQEQSASSRSSVNVNGGGYGHGFGGIGGLYGNGFGGAGFGNGGMSSYNSQSSSSYQSSSSSVFNSFSGINSQIAAIQNMMHSGSFSQSIAIQQMSRLASSFQTALSLSNGCGCFGNGQFVSHASSSFSQFYQLMTSMQSMFGGSFGSILQPFASLSSSFQSFFQSYSSSGYSLNSIVPTGFPTLMGGVMPGLPNVVGFK